VALRYFRGGNFCKLLRDVSRPTLSQPDFPGLHCNRLPDTGAAKNRQQGVWIPKPKS